MSAVKEIPYLAKPEVRILRSAERELGKAEEVVNSLMTEGLTPWESGWA